MSRKPIESCYVVNNFGCWVWQGALHNGYGHYKTVDGKTVRAHKYMYERLHGKVAEGLELDHLCEYRACVNPAHLEPVTSAVNVRRGRRAKLNEWKVAKIKEMLPYKNAKEIAIQFLVGEATITDIKMGRTWLGVS